MYGAPFRFASHCPINEHTYKFKQPLAVEYILTKKKKKKKKRITKMNSETFFFCFITATKKNNARLMAQNGVLRSKESKQSI